MAATWAPSWALPRLTRFELGTLLLASADGGRWRRPDADAVDVCGGVLVIVVGDGDGVVDVDGGVEVEVQSTFFRSKRFLCFASSAAFLPGLPAVELPPSPFFAAAADCLAGWLA